MGNGRLLFQDLPREIFVSLTLQKMMSHESVLCSVHPNRKIFQEKINDTISVLKIYPRFAFPFIRCFKTYFKMQCTIIIRFANNKLPWWWAAISRFPLQSWKNPGQFTSGWWISACILKVPVSSTSVSVTNFLTLDIPPLYVPDLLFHSIYPQKLVSTSPYQVQG